jgi:hypothetical protein
MCGGQYGALSEDYTEADTTPTAINARFGGLGDKQTEALRPQKESLWVVDVMAPHYVCCWIHVLIPIICYQYLCDRGAMKEDHRYDWEREGTEVLNAIP